MRHEIELIRESLASLDPSGPPRAVFIRQAPAGVRSAGALLCLSASFNPITRAHLALLEAGRRIIAADELLLLLSIANVDKPVVGLSLERRLRMLLRVAESRTNMSIALASHGRFVDKAEALRAHYPASTRLVFLLGLDTLVRLFDAKYYTDPARELMRLFSGCEIVAAPRGPAADALARLLAEPHIAAYAPHIRCVEVPAAVAAISATRVRERLAHGEDVQDLVPPEIVPLLTRD